MISQPTLSVVVVNYNTRDYLQACLESLQKTINIDLEIIVVDNASSDGSVEMVRSRFSDVNLIANTENQWFCGGNNTGIKASQGQYVLLLNPDTVVEPDALSLMVNFLDASPSYVGVTAQLIYPDGTTQPTCSRVPTYNYLLVGHSPLKWLFPKWNKRLQAHHWYEGWNRDRDYDVEAIVGACTLMRRDDIMLDADLLLYFPEDDLAKRNGGKCRFIADAHIQHHEKSATQTWSATDIYFRDLMIYTHKHHGFLATVLMKIATFPLHYGMWMRHILDNQRT
jgi:GT2 family glycosyltransferase